MKPVRFLTYCVAFTLGRVLVGQAQTISYIVSQFDANTSGYFQDQHWGTAVPSITWDGSHNAITTLATNRPGSGSSAWAIPWTSTGDQIMVTHAFSTTLDMNQFATVSYDIEFAPSSATDGAGRDGVLEVDWIPTADGWPSTANPGQAYASFDRGNTNWIHVSMPINAGNVSKLKAVNGMGFKMQQNKTGANLTGTTLFWIDNIILSGFITATNPPPSGPPQIVQLNAAQPWQRLEFQVVNLPPILNPFDPDSMSVDATYSLPGGGEITVPGFWYQSFQRSLNNGAEQLTALDTPQWRLRFTPTEAGTYSVSVAVKTNGVVQRQLATNFSVSGSSPLRSGYAGLTADNQYFRTGDGQALPLSGLNVAWWTTQGTYDYDKWFSAMQSAGAHFARVWMCPWSFGLEHTANSRTNYSLGPPWQLDYVLQLAEQKGIYMQLCLDYHGMFEVTPDFWGGNNYWPQHPYNVANGGPCVNQNGFFTNLTAKALYKKRLRYLVARYGYSPNVLAWEFFNEIDHEYGYLSSKDVAAWHSEMGQWLHTNDPFKHLVTTSLSYAGADPGLWSVPQLDFLSWHTYFNGRYNPAVVMANDASWYRKAYGRAVQIGEYGTDWRGWAETIAGDPYLRGLRQGIWGGALGGSVGTAMSWWWDSIHNANAYWPYSSLGRILNRTGWGRGSWTNLVFPSGQPLAAIGQCGTHESLIYVVAAGATFPTGATIEALPEQTNQTLIVANLAAGLYYAEWYDPVTGALIGNSRAVTTNGGLKLPLPDYNVDLAGIVYPPPTLQGLGVDESGNFHFRLISETGGRYTIQESSDLLKWYPIQVVTNVLGVTDFVAAYSKTTNLFIRASR